MTQSNHETDAVVLRHESAPVFPARQIVASVLDSHGLCRFPERRWLDGLEGRLFIPVYKTIIGGENTIAVEQMGAKKIGLDPIESRIFTLAAAAFGMPEIDRVGDKSVLIDWVNVLHLIDRMMDVGEEYCTYANRFGFISSEMDSVFPPKTRYRSVLFARRVMKHAPRLMLRYGW